MNRPPQRVQFQARCAAMVFLWASAFCPGAAAGPVVTRTALRATLIESGEIEALHQMIVSAPPTWRQKLQITALIPEGEIVRAGDFLIQLDDSELRAELALAESRAATLRADLEKIRAQQSLKGWEQENAIALAQFSREQAVLREQLQEFESDVSRERARLQLRQAELDLERAREQDASQEIIHRSQLAKASIEIRQAESEMASLQDRIAHFTIRAPMDGIVVYKEVGGWSGRERLRTGYAPRPGEGLLAIPDLTQMQVVLQLNEVDWSQVRTGQRARIFLEAYPDTAFDGVVRVVAKLAQRMHTRGGEQGFSAYIDILAQDARLKPGMSARVAVILTEYPDVLIAPIAAVFEIDGQPVIFPAKDPEPHAVYLGARNDHAVIIERGAREGMELCAQDPTGRALPLGSAAERRKVEQTAKMVSESLSIFAQRGILYDYDARSGNADQGDAHESRE